MLRLSRGPPFDKALRSISTASSTVTTSTYEVQDWTVPRISCQRHHDEVSPVPAVPTARAQAARDSDYSLMHSALSAYTACLIGEADLRLSPEALRGNSLRVGMEREPSMVDRTLRRLESLRGKGTVRYLRAVVIQSSGYSFAPIAPF